MHVVGQSRESKANNLMQERVLEALYQKDSKLSSVDSYRYAQNRYTSILREAFTP